MFTKPSKLLFLLLRVALYLTVVVALLLWRDRLPVGSLLDHLRASQQKEKVLTLGGCELAQPLVERVVAHYRRDYPDLHIRLQGGGTNQALEALLNGDCTAAFLYRPVRVAEQNLFLAAGRDSVVDRPIALGALVFLSGASSLIDSLTLEEVQGFFTSPGSSAIEHIYAPDPNFGLWDALRERLAVVPSEDRVPPGVIFLKDTAAVAQAVVADARSVGVASTFSLPFDGAPTDTRILSLSVDGSEPAVAPGRSEVASSSYPLYHYLYIAIRKHEDIQAVMFVTHMTSGKGQRQIQRAGYLPAKLMPMEVQLTTHPLGDSR